MKETLLARAVMQCGIPGVQSAVNIWVCLHATLYYFKEYLTNQKLK